MELYKIMEDDLAPKLTDLLNELHAEGALPERMRSGDITVLYKKKDPRDVRNYRPITLTGRLGGHTYCVDVAMPESGHALSFALVHGASRHRSL